MQVIQHSLLDERDISLSVLRLDRIHPEINGNKWFKLKLNLQQISDESAEQVLSFGGAWSNHLLALAASGYHSGFKTYGVIRGEQMDPPTPVVKRLKELGMTLIPISRAQYREKTDPTFLDSLRRQIGQFYLLPEGGTNKLAVEGCMEIPQFFQWSDTLSPKVVAGACGTGGMLSGVILGIEQQDVSSTIPNVLGVSVLKAKNYLAGEIAHWLEHFKSENTVSWQIAEGYHCGGYAKSSVELSEFLACFDAQIGIPVEPVYTGKLAFGLYHEIQTGRIEPGSEIIAIHSGGLI